jgi:hypothetical protein
MSFLYPLFLAGITAISVPIILHLIRRHTRKRVTFSSLMFLRTTVPRFKSRSRLENLPLLILRCLILVLLALAFSRPFFVRPVSGEPKAVGRRIVLLIDTSASMRRAGMWTQAVNEVRSVLNDLEPADRVSVMSFDQNTSTLIGFEGWSEMDPGRRAATILEDISKLSPTWASTNLGNALVTAAEAIEDDEINDQLQTLNQRRIVLISDLQQGANLDALHTYQWPGEIELVVKLIKARGNTNAAMQLVTNRDYLSRSGGKEQPRVRITNSADATVEQFQLSWADDDPATAAGKPLPVYVPPGHNIVTRVPGEPNSVMGRKLVLKGDDQTFDNTLYLAPNLDRQVNILYIGNDNPEDPEKMLYYVRRAFQPAGRFKPRIVSEQADSPVGDEDIQTAHLIIVTGSIDPQRSISLRRVMEAGSTILLVMNSADAAATIVALTGLDQMNCEEAKVDEYAMLGPIEFEHPLLSAFSEPRFGDFTKIHFWKYRRINIENIPKVRVLARFDNDDPALFELPLGRGSLLVLTSGWNPSDSQLALSSKFVPLLYSILEYNGVFDGQRSQYFVGDSIRIPRPRTTDPANLRIRKPDNSLIDLDLGRQDFDQTQLPGIYTIESPAGNQLFAVNISPQECRTAPLPLDELEQFGISFQGASNVLGDKILQARQHSSLVEMEHQQRLWRWLLIALLAVLLVETWLAGWLTRPAVLTQGEEK